MRALLLSGLPGSGKSEYAAKLAAENDDCYVLSAASKGREAHKDCLKAFIYAIQSKVPLLVVDNGNVEATQIAPYYELAEAYGYQVEILEFHCSQEQACKAKPEIPTQTIAWLYSMFEKRRLPKWWKVRRMDELSKEGAA